MLFVHSVNGNVTSSINPFVTDTVCFHQLSGLWCLNYHLRCSSAHWVLRAQAKPGGVRDSTQPLSPGGGSCQGLGGALPRLQPFCFLALFLFYFLLKNNTPRWRPFLPVFSHFHCLWSTLTFTLATFPLKKPMEVVISLSCLLSPSLKCPCIFPLKLLLHLFSQSKRSFHPN